MTTEKSLPHPVYPTIITRYEYYLGLGGLFFLSALMALLFSPGNSVFSYLVGLAPCPPGPFQGFGASLTQVSGHLLDSRSHWFPLAALISQGT